MPPPPSPRPLLKFAERPPMAGNVMVPRAQAHRAAAVVVQQLLIAGLYVGAAYVAFHAAVVSGTACPVWPPTAVALVAVLRLGRRALPGLFVGALVANATRPVPALVVLATATINLAEPLVTRAVLGRLRMDARLVSARDVAGFTAAVGAGAIVSAAGGVGALLAAGIVSPSILLGTIALWWLGNVTGALCTAPLALVPGTRGHAGRIEEAAVLACTVLAGLVVLGSPDLQVYVVFPVLIWAGLRLGPRGAAAVVLALSTIAVAETARGVGPFVRDTPTASLLTAQTFIIVIALTTLLLAAITEDRRRAGQALRRSEDAKRALADEQAALRRLAEAAARATAPEEVLELAAREVAALLDVGLAVVVRYLPRDRVLVLGEHGAHAHDGVAGTVMGIAAGGAVDLARAGRPARDRRAPADCLRGLTRHIAAPIVVDARVWGALLVAGPEQPELPPSTEARLARFADILALAVSEAQARARLRAQATTDPLTGLLNHRAFHERLREEVAGARRHGRPLSVAVFDLDHFKEINDAFGHAQGDVVLAEATRRLVAASRADEPVGRVGGDELAVIMPGTDGIAAHRAADRMRRAVAAEPFEGIGALTVSAGTCDLTEADGADELLRLADGALYWAKAHGRDACFRYSPDVVEELSAGERAERLARGQALSGVRALARAIDAKDPSTIRHSERVAELVGRLAELAGWDAGRVALVREAGLVHDVGKIGVPDVVLFKRGRLNAAERTQVERHAALGAQIASEVLEPEQAAWIRAHHERHDGAGYPDGLAGTAIPEGARLLALADAWDAMTRARPYTTPMSTEAAWVECRRQSGRQFAPEAVRLLGELIAAGRLPHDDDDAGAWSTSEGAVAAG